MGKHVQRQCAQRHLGFWPEAAVPPRALPAGESRARSAVRARGAAASAERGAGRGRAGGAVPWGSRTALGSHGHRVFILHGAVSSGCLPGHCCFKRSGLLLQEPGVVEFFGFFCCVFVFFFKPVDALTT